MRSEEDKLLSRIIEKNTLDADMEVAINVLQVSLQKKIPFVPHARLGGENGLRLNRAAFAVILKFSCQTQAFQQFMVEVATAAESANPGDDLSNHIIQQLKTSSKKLYDMLV